MSNKIDMIIWSRNRPMQCFLLLQSTKDHFKNIGNIFILYKADNKRFKEGYEKLMNKDYGMNIEFIQEKDFENDIKNILSNKVQTEYVLGNSDDNVFIRKVEFHEFRLPSEVVAFSLRLGKSINHCLPAKLDLEQPEFNLDSEHYLSWEWTNSDPRGCWGYPHPVDSNIYRKQYWIDLLKEGHFNNPKTMEEYMNTHRNIKYPYMMSFQQSCLISISANELGQGSELVNKGISLLELNEHFFNDYIISTENIYNINVNSCHILLDYKLRKEDEN